MIVGSNYLNVALASRGLYVVMSRSGEELSGLHDYAEIHSVCYSHCVKGDDLYKLFTGCNHILADVPGDYVVWLDFSDGCYHARPASYVPKWYEININNVKEIIAWLEAICQRTVA